MCETSIHGRDNASGSEFDATRDGRRTRCVSQSLNTPDARTHATRFFPGEGNPAQTYEAFVETWLEDGQGQWDGNREAVVASVFDAFADAEFVGLCWSALQWDQGTFENPSHFLIEALRADGVRSPLMFNQGNGANRYTPLKDDYVTAGGTYRITDFAPHAHGCDESEVCPGCQQ
ncbi:MAG: hypothetical protein KJZ69_16725 [Phycisphaerales bacterium]|nr:hypothetical protein [Phycisphaerales bacterium]